MGRSPEPDSATGDKLRRALADSRDDAVRAVSTAGLSIVRIQQISGLASTTIMRILNSHPGRRRTG